MPPEIESPAVAELDNRDRWMQIKLEEQWGQGFFIGLLIGAFIAAVTFASLPLHPSTPQQSND